MKTHQVFIILGSNLGDREKNLERAIVELGRLGMVKAWSQIYFTQPWGVDGHPEYLNQVVEIETTLPPGGLMLRCLKIERILGRAKRSETVQPRIIDIDILLYDDRIVNQKKVTIPHPRLHLRRFALIPLAELAPDKVHPMFKLTIKQLLAECSDVSTIHQIEQERVV